MSEKNEAKPYIIAIPIYDGVDLMDIAAPREIFSWLSGDANFKRGLNVYFVGDTSRKTFTTSNGVEMKIEKDFNDHDPLVARPDLIWVPGGRPQTLRNLMNGCDKTGPAFFSYIEQAAKEAEYVCSVCEGAVLLAHTGLLDGYEITTHWAFVHCFSDKVKVVEGNPRYHKDRNRVTGGGISSGLDESLYLVSLIAGEASAVSIQQTMQYYPCPPVNSVIPTAEGCPVPIECD
ncbi:MAG: transcriptional regulator GlxA family with amidase domain [Crocinitomicaceae bacterium]|jgi:transcriptional regulator GlxA family with amidase domain